MDNAVIEKLDKLEKLVMHLASNMVTKEDTKVFVTKDDLKKLATKEDLKSSMKSFRRDIISRFDDVDRKLNKMDHMQTAIFQSTDKIKADKIEVKKLDNRITKLERKVNIN